MPVRLMLADHLLGGIAKFPSMAIARIPRPDGRGCFQDDDFESCIAPADGFATESVPLTDRVRMTLDHDASRHKIRYPTDRLAGRQLVKAHPKQTRRLKNLRIVE